jgi:hypothetical protein
MEYTKERAIGYAAVETDGDHQLTDGLCIKKPGQPLQMPERIMIAARKLGDFGYVCEDTPEASERQGIEVCVWNHKYRNTYPMTFTFVAEGKGTKVADYLALARVYRNGHLIARYNAASQLQNPQVLVFRAEELHVSDSPFSPRPPHLAQMDLRVVPAGVEVEQSILSEVIYDADELGRERLLDMTEASLTALDPTLVSGLNCAAARLRYVRAVVASLSSKQVLPVLPAECALEPPPRGLEPISSRYSGILNPAELDELEGKVESSLNQVRDWVAKQSDKLKNDTTLPQWIVDRQSDIAKEEQKLEGLVGAARASVLERLAKWRLELQAAVLSLERLNAACEEVASSVAAAGETAQRAGAAARRALTDQETQLRMYDAALKSLQDSGTIFEPYQSNPPPLPGELRLSMRHGDSFQLYGLAPWNGVALRVDDGPNGSVGWENLVPFLDAVGFRVQWNDNRFSEFRMATGIMYFADAEIDPDTDETNKDFTFGFHVNMSIANFKIGCGIAPWADSSGDLNDSDFTEKIRLLVGADLIKIISGSTADVRF